jgi:hypothetical protein
VGLGLWVGQVSGRQATRLAAYELVLLGGVGWESHALCCTQYHGYGSAPSGGHTAAAVPARPWPQLTHLCRLPRACCQLLHLDAASSLEELGRCVILRRCQARRAPVTCRSSWCGFMGVQAAVCNVGAS